MLVGGDLSGLLTIDVSREIVEVSGTLEMGIIYLNSPFAPSKTASTHPTHSSSA